MNFPQGWILRMNKFPRKPLDQFRSFEEEFEQPQKRTTYYTSFGNFDRMEFVPIYDYTDYQKYLVSDDNWLGKQQAILLYALRKESQARVFNVREESSQDGWVGRHQLDFQDMSSARYDSPCPLFAHTMIYVSGAAKFSANDYSEFLDIFAKRVQHIVTEYRNAKAKQGRPEERLACEVFGTFNSAEISIIWAADQYVDIMYLVDQIRYLRFSSGERGASKGQIKRLCLSTYTVISAYLQGWPSVQGGGIDRNWLLRIKGRAVVQLETSTVFEPKQATDFGLLETNAFLEQVFEQANKVFPDLREKLSIQNVLFSAGEYDIVAEMPFYYLGLIFSLPRDAHDGKNLSTHNEETARFFQQTTTRLGYRTDDIESACQELDWDELLTIRLSPDNLSDWEAARHLPVLEQLSCCKVSVDDFPKSGKVYRGKTYDLYQRIHRQLRDVVPNAGLHKTLELLYRDYEEILCTAFDPIWTRDYHEQFNTVLHIIQSTMNLLRDMYNTEPQRIEPAEFLHQIQTLFEILQQQVNHISESSKLFFEAPNSKMGYTAQFDLVMHAFYGLVKHIISQANRASRISWQYTLVPVINFSNTSVIKSTMLSGPDEAVTMHRLISLRVPYDVWADPLYYAAYLFHELYHYVAPQNRSERNRVYLAIVMHRVCSLWLYADLQRFFGEKYAGIEDKNLPKNALGKSPVEALPRDVSIPFSQLLFQYLGQNSGELLRQMADREEITAHTLRDRIENWFVDENKHKERTEWRRSSLKAILPALLQELEKWTPPDKWQAYVKENGLDYLRHLEKTDCKVAEYDFSRQATTSGLAVLSELRELYPDMAMIHGTGMGLCDYLVQFALLQIDQLSLPEHLRENTELALRIGPIIEYFLREKTHSHRTDLDNFKLFRDEFCQMFRTRLECSRVLESTKVADRCNLASRWFTRFSEIYQEYKISFGVYSASLRAVIRDQFVFSDSEESKKLENLFKNYWALLCHDAAGEDVASLRYELIIRFIHLFQKQDSLDHLVKAWQSDCKTPPADPASAGSGASGKSPISTYKTKELDNYNITEYTLIDGDLLFEALHGMTRTLSENHKELFHEPCTASGIWYRGINDSGFKMLPSMFVRFSKGKEMERFPFTLPATILEHRLQQFKLRSDGAPEMFAQYRYESSDYLAMMQHYYLPTNMLDWSEDVFGSLFFALQGYITKGDPSIQRKEDKDAAVFLLDPQAYNRARAIMLHSLFDKNSSHHYTCWTPCSYSGKGYAFCKACRYHHVKNLSQSIEESRGLIPNISTDLNRNLYDHFFCKHRREYLQGKEYYLASELGGDPNIAAPGPLRLYLPVAVYTSRFSNRIRAQSGQFVVYDPYTPPVFKEEPRIDASTGQRVYDQNEGCFDYAALDELQKGWLKLSTENKPFMLKLIIKADVKEKLAGQLHLMGISTIKYYPELGNARFSFD